MSHLLLQVNPWITELCFAKEKQAYDFCAFLLLFYRILNCYVQEEQKFVQEKSLRSF